VVETLGCEHLFEFGLEDDKAGCIEEEGWEDRYRRGYFGEERIRDGRYGRKSQS